MPEQSDQINPSGIVERYIVFKTSGSIKERTQTSTEMGTGYSDQSSVRSWLAQPIKELSSAAGLCAGRGCALIRQLANSDTLISRSLFDRHQISRQSNEVICGFELSTFFLATRGGGGGAVAKERKFV